MNLKKSKKSNRSEYVEVGKVNPFITKYRERKLPQVNDEDFLPDPERRIVLAMLYDIFKHRRTPINQKLSAARLILEQLSDGSEYSTRTGSISRADFLIKSLLETKQVD